MKSMYAELSNQVLQWAEMVLEYRSEWVGLTWRLSTDASNFGSRIGSHMFTVLLHKLHNCITSLLDYLTHFQFTVAIAKRVTSEVKLLADSVSLRCDNVLQTLNFFEDGLRTRLVHLQNKVWDFFSSHFCLDWQMFKSLYIPYSLDITPPFFAD